MRSRAQFKGHPIHPGLIPFPFAFLTGAAVFDTLALLMGHRALGLTGAYLTLAGIAGGVVAAIPGVIDYLYTVPPRSSARARALRHGAGNLVALGSFGLAFALRASDWQPSVPSIGLELIGTCVLLYAGWLGGTLVTRNLIGVDHRYAEAGKWQESEITAQRGPVVVGHVNDLKENQMKLLHVNGRRVVLARTSSGYRAFDDRCTHRGASLAGGVLICGTVQCLWHGSQFDVTTGAVTCGPAGERIPVYELSEGKDGKLSLASPPE